MFDRKEQKLWLEQRHADFTRRYGAYMLDDERSRFEAELMRLIIEHVQVAQAPFVDAAASAMSAAAAATPAFIIPKEDGS